MNIYQLTNWYVLLDHTSEIQGNDIERSWKQTEMTRLFSNSWVKRFEAKASKLKTRFERGRKPIMGQLGGRSCTQIHTLKA